MVLAGALTLLMLSVSFVNVASSCRKLFLLAKAAWRCLRSESDKIIDICRTVEAECGEAVQAVNFNCPGQVVIAGSVGAVDKALAALKEAGAKRAVLLPVSAPFHSTLMQPASKRLAEVFETITFHDAKIPVVANVTATEVTKGEEIKESLIRQAACLYFGKPLSTI
ncbi:MAG: ACP S-malonyltransferase [Phascolarctobacterium faecium]